MAGSELAVAKANSFLQQTVERNQSALASAHRQRLGKFYSWFTHLHVWFKNLFD